MDTRHHETLGNNVIPSVYRIRLEPGRSRFGYDGYEEIEVEVANGTSSIALNAAELSIVSASVLAMGEEHEARVKLDEKRQRMVIELGRKISGSATIKIAFAGTNNDKMYGFYRSRYMQDGKERYMLTTQFEAANARNAFPCFDEPAFKAEFELTLVAQKGLTCISNMPAASEEDLGNEKRAFRFMKTPRMSSYLLYAGIGEFSRKVEKRGRMEVGVITTPGKEKYADLALGYAIKFLDYFEKYFGIKYPLPKLDLIAVPDFSAGAMENWGAITFRENALLGDQKSSVGAKQRIAEVIAHELVHQWFGDLVTMKWWNDLWLNESFANFMSYKAMDAVFPEWEMMSQYTAGVVGTAFAVDQLSSTHPISVKVETPSDIDQIFDEISYNKGGAVLSMIEDYVGKENFRKGLNRYLEKNAYSNAEKEDLWNAVGEVSDKKDRKMVVPEVARSWIDNKGYPSVEIAFGNGEIRLYQKRFMLLEEKPDNTRWLIPVSMVQPPEAHEERILMTGKKAVVRTERKGPFKLNHLQKGFYRTIYEVEMLDKLGGMVKDHEISGIDSWGIEGDMYALMKKGRYSIKEYLEFVEKYCFAARYPLNMSVLSHLRSIFLIMEGEDERISRETGGLLREYSGELIKEVGWKRSNDETTNTTLIRSSAILGSGISGEKSTINKVQRIFAEGDGRTIDPNLKAAAYGVMAWSGNAATYEKLKNMYREETVPEDKTKLLASLGMFSEPLLIRKALDFSMSDEVRYQDSFYIPAYVSSNPAGKGILMDWTKRNWDGLESRFKSGTHMLGRYVDNLASSTKKGSKAEISRFFSPKSKSRPDIRSSLDQTLEIVEINSGFISRSKASWKND